MTSTGGGVGVAASLVSMAVVVSAVVDIVTVVVGGGGGDEVLIVVGASVVEGRGARGGRGTVKAEAKEASVSSTTREGWGKNKELKTR